MPNTMTRSLRHLCCAQLKFFECSRDDHLWAELDERELYLRSIPTYGICGAPLRFLLGVRPSAREMAIERSRAPLFRHQGSADERLAAIGLHCGWKAS